MSAKPVVRAMVSGQCRPMRVRPGNGRCGLELRSERHTEVSPHVLNLSISLCPCVLRLCSGLIYLSTLVSPSWTNPEGMQIRCNAYIRDYRPPRPGSGVATGIPRSGEVTNEKLRAMLPAPRSFWGPSTRKSRPRPRGGSCRLGRPCRTLLPGQIILDARG